MMNGLAGVNAVLVATALWAMGSAASAQSPAPQSALAPSTRPSAPEGQMDVYVSGTAGYHTYRIPSLIVTKKGTILAFCEGRKNSRSDTGDIDLLMKRSADGGKTWSDAMLVWNDKGNTCGNPCPVVDQGTGVIWLLMTWNRGDDNEAAIKAGTGKDTRRVFVSSSADDGATWTRPVDITASVKHKDWRWYATGPGVGIQLQRGPHKGRLVVPCDHSSAAGYGSHAIFSDDHGKTWRYGEPILPDVNECQVVELIDGSLLMNMRNYKRSHSRMRAVASSRDGGVTWSRVEYVEALPEPICQASFIRYSTQEGGGKPVLLFSNPAEKKGREKMTVRASFDEGKTWPVSKLIYPDGAAYSCLAVLPDKTIGLLYERDGYKTITFARMTLESLTAGPPKPPATAPATQPATRPAETPATKSASQPATQPAATTTRPAQPATAPVPTPTTQPAPASQPAPPPATQPTPKPTTQPTNQPAKSS